MVAKLTVNAKSPAAEAPSAAALTAGKDITVTLPSGAVVTLAEPDILAEFNFVEIVGPVRSANPAWMNMAMPYAFVAAIQDPGEEADQVTLSSYNQLQILQKRIGKGYAELVAAVQAHFTNPDAGGAHDSAKK